MGWETNEQGELVFVPDTGGGGSERKTQTVKRANGSTVLIDSMTGEEIRVIDPGPAPAPVKNHGNGVFEDESGLFIQNVNGSKEYITEAEAKQRIDSEAPARGGGGSGDATAWANVGLRGQELTETIRANQAREQADIAQLAEQIRSNRAAEAYSWANLDFLSQKEAFAQSQDDKRLANETRAQIFNERSTIATLQQNRSTLQAQMEQRTQEFNASMQFQTQQANDQAQRAKRQDLAQNARDIAEFSDSPTDWGKLASFQLANTGWGQGDAAIQEEGGFITDRSLQPLAKGLNVRDEINAQPDNPFTFTPLTTPELPQIDLSFLTAGLPGGMQTGTAGPIVNEAEQNKGWTLDTKGTQSVDDDKWIGPAIDWETVRASKNLPKMAEGGMTQGAFIAGDSPDGSENEEMIIPLAGGQTLIVPLKGKQKPKGMKHYATGGVFDSGIFGNDVDTTRAREFQTEASRRARMGTPWETGPLPGAAFASSPIIDPQTAALIASMRGLELGESPEFFSWRTNRLRPAGVQDGVIGRTR